MVLGRKPYSYIFLEKCFPVKCTLCQYAEFEGSTCSPSEIHLLIANLINVPFPSVGRGQRLWLWVFERHRWEPRLCDQPRVWARNPPGGTIIFSLLMKRFHFLDFNALIFLCLASHFDNLCHIMLILFDKLIISLYFCLFSFLYFYEVVGCFH